MNLFSELVDLVDSHREIEEAVEALAREIADSGREREQLERSLDVVRQAFRKHVQGSGGSVRVVCGFCKKTDEEVARIVTASDVAICDECVTLCNDVIEERVQSGVSDTPPLTRAIALFRRKIKGR